MGLFHVDCGLETFAIIFCSLKFGRSQSFAWTERLKYATISPYFIQIVCCKCR
jgi:hypothetical protein